MLPLKITDSLECMTIYPKCPVYITALLIHCSKDAFQLFHERNHMGIKDPFKCMGILPWQFCHRYGFTRLFISTNCLNCHPGEPVIDWVFPREIKYSKVIK